MVKSGPENVPEMQREGGIPYEKVLRCSFLLRGVLGAKDQTPYLFRALKVF